MLFRERKNDSGINWWRYTAHGVDKVLAGQWTEMNCIAIKFLFGCFKPFTRNMAGVIYDSKWERYELHGSGWGLEGGSEENHGWQ